MRPDRPDEINDQGGLSCPALHWSRGERAASAPPSARRSKRPATTSRPTYGGNDEAAQKFKAETGINVYKWDVSSFEACAAGVKQVEADLGPVDVLVNNAGITRDSPAPPHEAGTVDAR